MTLVRPFVVGSNVYTCVEHFGYDKKLHGCFLIETVGSGNYEPGIQNGTSANILIFDRTKEQEKTMRIKKNIFLGS